MAKSRGIYLTLSLWSMLSPKLVVEKTSKCLPKEHGDKASKQDDGDDADGKDESLGAP
jgi:hypothetical protein